MSRFFGKEALAGFLFLLILSGCASMDRFEFKQPVKLLSDPPGAKVFFGPEYLGTTPAYIRVPREKSPQLTYVFPNGEKQQVELETRYRWGGSFASNLFLLTLAPAGWAWDLYRGTAWNIDTPEVVRQPGSQDWPKILPPKVVAIAPPVINQYSRIYNLGVTIEERLKADEKFKVLDYDKTESNFRYNRSYQGLSDRQSDLLRLYSTLQADHILESKGEFRGDTYHVRAELRDIVTGRVDKVYNWEVSPPREEEVKSPVAWFIKRSFHLIPNTVFISSTNFSPSIQINNIDQRGKESPNDSTLEQIADKISSISIARLDRSNYDVRGHWVFDFVPLLMVSKKNIIFPDSPNLIDAEFQRWLVNAGYGIETGYIGRYGFVYLDLFPSLAWTQLKYDGKFESGTIQTTKVVFTYEIGYSYFFSDHIVGRLHARVVQEDGNAWGKAIRGAAGVDLRTGEMGSGYGGISIGYYFDTPGRRAGWRIR